MSLKNIYYWHEGSWRKITAEEFLKNNSGVRISAKDKYFWCEMCGQYVSLANGNVNKPHFRHYSAELKKDCEDRAKNFSKTDWINFSEPSQSLPIKICIEQNKFFFKIGLIRLPAQLFDEVRNCCITIQAGEKILNRNDLSDYLLKEKTTWLDVGNFPEKFYSLKLDPEISDAHFYWTEKISGVNSQGTLFDVVTGKKILNDADVKIETKYYLLTTSEIENFVDGINVKFLFKNFNWRLYEIEAYRLSEEAAKFFLDYHCRLTDKPISIQPIYPVFTQYDDIIHCNASKMFIYFSGNAKIKFFPRAKNARLFKKNDTQIIEVELDERQKMIAAGRSQLLKYLYLWKDSPTQEIEMSKIEVTDSSGKIIKSGIYDKLPKNLRLQVQSEFDCKIIIRKNNVVERKFFKKDGDFYIDDIKFGMDIKIFQGLDCVWSAIYKSKNKRNSQADEELFLKLERSKGAKIKIPHTWGNFADKLKDFPKVRNWLYNAIRAGFVNEDAYLLFRQFILNF